MSLKKFSNFVTFVPKPKLRLLKEFSHGVHTNRVCFLETKNLKASRKEMKKYEELILKTTDEKKTRIILVSNLLNSLPAPMPTKFLLPRTHKPNLNRVKGCGSTSKVSVLKPWTTHKNFSTSNALSENANLGLPKIRARSLTTKSSSPSDSNCMEEFKEFSYNPDLSGINDFLLSACDENTPELLHGDNCYKLITLDDDNLIDLTVDNDKEDYLLLMNSENDANLYKVCSKGVLENNEEYLVLEECYQIIENQDIEEVNKYLENKQSQLVTDDLIKSKVTVALMDAPHSDSIGLRGYDGHAEETFNSKDLEPIGNAIEKEEKTENREFNGVNDIAISNREEDLSLKTVYTKKYKNTKKILPATELNEVANESNEPQFKTLEKDGAENGTEEFNESPDSENAKNSNTKVEEIKGDAIPTNNSANNILSNLKKLLNEGVDIKDSISSQKHPTDVPLPNQATTSQVTKPQSEIISPTVQSNKYKARKHQSVHKFERLHNAKQHCSMSVTDRLKLILHSSNKDAEPQQPPEEKPRNSTSQSPKSTVERNERTAVATKSDLNPEIGGMSKSLNNTMAYKEKPEKISTEDCLEETSRHSTENIMTTKQKTRDNENLRESAFDSLGKSDVTQIEENERQIQGANKMADIAFLSKPLELPIENAPSEDVKSSTDSRNEAKDILRIDYKNETKDVLRSDFKNEPKEILRTDYKNESKKEILGTNSKNEPKEILIIDYMNETKKGNIGTNSKSDAKETVETDSKNEPREMVGTDSKNEPKETVETESKNEANEIIRSDSKNDPKELDRTEAKEFFRTDFTNEPKENKPKDIRRTDAKQEKSNEKDLAELSKQSMLGNELTKEKISTGSQETKIGSDVDLKASKLDNCSDKPIKEPEPQPELNADQSSQAMDNSATVTTNRPNGKNKFEQINCFLLQGNKSTNKMHKSHNDSNFNPDVSSSILGGHAHCSLIKYTPPQRALCVYSKSPELEAAPEIKYTPPQRPSCVYSKSSKLEEAPEIKVSKLEEVKPKPVDIEPAVLEEPSQSEVTLRMIDIMNNAKKVKRRVNADESEEIMKQIRNYENKFKERVANRMQCPTSAASQLALKSKDRYGKFTRNKSMFPKKSTQSGFPRVQPKKLVPNPQHDSKKPLKQEMVNSRTSEVGTPKLKNISSSQTLNLKSQTVQNKPAESRPNTANISMTISRTVKKTSDLKPLAPPNDTKSPKQMVNRLPATRKSKAKKEPLKKMTIKPLKTPAVKRKARNFEPTQNSIKRESEPKELKSEQSLLEVLKQSSKNDFPSSTERLNRIMNSNGEPSSKQTTSQVTSIEPNEQKTAGHSKTKKEDIKMTSESKQVAREPSNIMKSQPFKINLPDIPRIRWNPLENIKPKVAEQIAENKSPNKLVQQKAIVENEKPKERVNTHPVKVSEKLEETVDPVKNSENTATPHTDPSEAVVAADPKVDSTSALLDSVNNLKELSIKPSQITNKRDINTLEEVQEKSNDVTARLNKFLHANLLHSLDVRQKNAQGEHMKHLVVNQVKMELTDIQQPKQKQKTTQQSKEKQARRPLPRRLVSKRDIGVEQIPTPSLSNVLSQNQIRYHEKKSFRPKLLSKRANEPEANQIESIKYLQREAVPKSSQYTQKYEEFRVPNSKKEEPLEKMVPQIKRKPSVGKSKLLLRELTKHMQSDRKEKQIKKNVQAFLQDPTASTAFSLETSPKTESIITPEISPRKSGNITNLHKNGILFETKLVKVKNQNAKYSTESTLTGNIKKFHSFNKSKQSVGLQNVVPMQNFMPIETGLKTLPKPIGNMYSMKFRSCAAPTRKFSLKKRRNLKRFLINPMVVKNTNSKTLSLEEMFTPLKRNKPTFVNDNLLKMVIRSGKDSVANFTPKQRKRGIITRTDFNFGSLNSLKNAYNRT